MIADLLRKGYRLMSSVKRAQPKDDDAEKNHDQECYRKYAEAAANAAIGRDNETLPDSLVLNDPRVREYQQIHRTSF